MIRRFAILTALLVIFLYLGVAAIPMILAQGGTFVPSGTVYTIPYQNFIMIPFAINSNPMMISGAYTSNALVYLYIFNSSQFDEFNDGGFCPITTGYTFAATGGSLNFELAQGSYNLVFCANSSNPSTATVTITSPISLLSR
jgi:hypothetical protein